MAALGGSVRKSSVGTSRKARVVEHVEIGATGEAESGRGLAGSALGRAGGAFEIRGVSVG